eukprot:116706-Pelagomonas_calceolata.AAC.2
MYTRMYEKGTNLEPILPVHVCLIPATALKHDSHSHHAHVCAEGTNLEPILPVLARVFDRALEGGGAKNINFQELSADLAQELKRAPSEHVCVCLHVLLCTLLARESVGENAAKLHLYGLHRHIRSQYGLFVPASSLKVTHSCFPGLYLWHTQITFDYPFRIPPYFALIIRAISVLEGTQSVWCLGALLHPLCLAKLAGWGTQARIPPPPFYLVAWNRSMLCGWSTNDYHH